VSIPNFNDIFLHFYQIFIKEIYCDLVMSFPFEINCDLNEIFYLKHFKYFDIKPNFKFSFFIIIFLNQLFQILLHHFNLIFILRVNQLHEFSFANPNFLYQYDVLHFIKNSKLHHLLFLL
jgi:hypothetical protein